MRSLPINQSRPATYDMADEPSEEEALTDSEDIDPLQEFYSSWGYLSPLDEEASAVIEEIIAHSDIAIDPRRIGPENDAEFTEGLQWRNVSVEEEGPHDSYIDVIKSLQPKEVEEELEPHRQLWTWDQEKCADGSNEALFQRTLMMSLIARHRLIYTKKDKFRSLDFSVEETWACPPMPTRAYSLKRKFLTQPKPDLAVSFSRNTIIDNAAWKAMPSATRRLACFENATVQGQKRVFHFFTIEAKRALTSPNDPKGKLQSLNNASQALHNMFEFFRDAGSQHEKFFFDKVRFFSVVASTEGLTILIHRATRLNSKEPPLSFIMPENPQYPLNFEYQEYFKSAKFDRETISEIIQQILVRYGLGELRPLLKNAAEALLNRISNNIEERRRRTDLNFYRYGQTNVMLSKRARPATSQSSIKYCHGGSADRSEWEAAETGD